MTITGGSGEWDYRAEYTISVSGGAYFTSSDVGGNYSSLYTGTDPDTGDEVSKELRCDIISVTSNTAVVVRATGTSRHPSECGYHELADGAPDI